MVFVTKNYQLANQFKTVLIDLIHLVHQLNPRLGYYDLTC